MAQDTTHSTARLQWSGYVEAYYGYDVHSTADHQRAAFLYNHNRSQEITINLAFLKAVYQADRVRANLALGAGTYMNANYAAEPGVLKNLLEANVGVRLSPKKNLWLDAGILPSHIGFESAISKDCYTLTRSIVAENTPYFETGAKLSYASANQRWQFALLALNGWQRIQHVPGNSLVSAGLQVQYTTASGISLNYSNFIGADQPDTARLMRYYHNFYGSYRWSKLSLIAGFDWGMQQAARASSRYNNWISPVLVARYEIAKQWAAAARSEYFSDPASALISTATGRGFQVTGYSANLDYTPLANAKFRIEWRSLQSKAAIFPRTGGFARNNSGITVSMAVNF